MCVPTRGIIWIHAFLLHCCGLYLAQIRAVNLLQQNIHARRSVDAGEEEEEKKIRLATDLVILALQRTEVKKASKST